MVYFCDCVIGPEGLKCGLRIDKPGMCAEHSKMAAAEPMATDKPVEASKLEEPAHAAAPKKKGH